MISKKLSLGWSLVIFLFGATVLADHSNEGTQTLEPLIKEAEANNLEFKKMEQMVKSLEWEGYAWRGRFFPAFSIEGGQLFAKHEDENASGSFLFGKAEWNLYRGGFDESQIQKSQLSLELEKKKLQFAKIKIRNEVSKHYYEMLFILESLTLKERAIAMNEEQMKLARAKKNSGFTSQADVIEFELRNATLQSDLLLLNQDLEQKSKELAFDLGLNPTQAISSIKGHLHRDPTKLDQAKLLEQLKLNNVSLMESESQYQSSEWDKKISFAEYLPRFDIEAQYGRLASEERVFIGDVNYSVMLKVSIPLFSGLDTFNSQRAFNSLLQAKRYEMLNQRRSLELELKTILSSITILNQRLDIEEKNLARSEEYYKITLMEYKRGVKNSPDMVGASERLLDARIRNLEFRRDLSLMLLKVSEVVGVN